MVLICGAGFGVLDYLYNNLDYNSDGFRSCMSRKRGDGGVWPGHLSFVEAWLKMSGKTLPDLQKTMGWAREPDAANVGGPCIVAMINAAQITAGHGVKVDFYGPYGKDDTGRRMLDIVKKTPLGLEHFKEHASGATPYVICLADPNFNDGHGERSFGVDSGLYADLPLEKIITDEFFAGDVLYFGATALVPAIHDNLTNLLKRGKDLGKVTVVGTVFDHISEMKRPGQRWAMGENDDSFKNMDMLMVDMDEALGISGAKTLKGAAKFFMEKGVKSFTITHGAKSLYAWSDGTVYKKLPLRAFPICKKVTVDIKADPSKRGDTTGCGDNFCGGVLAYLGEALEKGIKPGQFNLVEAITWAVASGGFTCFVLGGTYIEQKQGEKREKVEAFRQSYIEQLRTAKL